jgi:hypothetical protein
MMAPDLVSQRLQNQKLSAPDFKKPADVVRWFGAVQAQDLNGAKWALALRMQNATHSRIEEAYNQGKIVRTHLMRPTWHFVAPEDIRWLLVLTAPRVNIKAGPYYRKYELDAGTFKRSHKALTKALQGGKHLMRGDLKTVLNQAGVAADDPIRLAHILLRAELDGVVCSGPMAGKQITYALLDERVPATKAPDRDEALGKLTRRYFTSHGPATLQDFIWWSGLTAADARRGVALVDRELVETLIDEKTYRSAKALRRAQRSERSAHLLPAYDEYLVAYQDRSAVSALDGLLGPAVIVDGRVVGTWKRTQDEKAVTIDLQPLSTLSNLERREISKAADRYAAFLDLPSAFVPFGG